MGRSTIRPYLLSILRDAIFEIAALPAGAMTLQIVNPYRKGRSCLIDNSPEIDGWFYPIS